MKILNEMPLTELLSLAEDLRSDSRSPVTLQLARRLRLYKEYGELLGDELTEVIGGAYMHGWRSSRVEEGKRLRKELGIPESNEGGPEGPKPKCDYCDRCLACGELRRTEEGR